MIILGESKTNEEQNNSKLLQHVFHKNWNNIFLIDAIHDISFTYGEFFSSIMHCKEKLQDLVLQKGDTICLLMNNSPELVILYFGSLLLGLSIVPLDHLTGKNDLKEILSQINYKKIISDNNQFVENVTPSNYFKSMNNDSISSSKVQIFDDIHYKIPFLTTFTSGSTGMPKRSA